MYGGNYGMFHDEWVNFGISITLISDASDTQKVKEAIQPNTK